MKIGFVGLGIMGESMCENIIKKHDDKVYVFDYVKEKVDKLAALGAVPCSSSKEVAENVSVLSLWFQNQSIPKPFMTRFFLF